MTTEELIVQLEDTREKTLGYFDLSEDLMELSYQPGKWTIKELLHHIVDAETVLYDRVRRGISKPGQVVWAFDQDAWSTGLSYKTIPLEINKSVYMAVRTAIIRLVHIYYIKADQYQYVHSATGLRTVKDEMEKFAWHNQHHLDQIKQALEQ